MYRRAETKAAEEKVYKQKQIGEFIVRRPQGDAVEVALRDTRGVRVLRGLLFA